MVSEYEKLKEEKLNEVRSEAIGIRTYPYIKKYYQNHPTISAREAIEYYAINTKNEYYPVKIKYLEALKQQHEVAIAKIEAEIKYLQKQIQH